MALFLIFIAVVITTCVLLNNASNRIGVPVLLAFILLGMLFGNNGLFPVKFDDYSFAEQTCTAALILIMFYGGFGTRWSTSKGVAVEASLLATVGVILTAGLTGLFCHFALKWPWIESFLMGSVISSTDAASVFSILRSRKLGLKNGTVPLLEIESGSNDPCSYMLTVIMLSLLKGEANGSGVVGMLFAQLGFGILFGVIIAFAAVFMMKRMHFATSGFDSLFILAVALFAYAIPTLVGGNGFLSAYLVGIILGNEDIPGKKELVNFFDGITGLMQVLIFFMLGLLARPAMLGKCILPALAIFFVMLLLSRPISIALLLTPFGKYGFRQQMLVSFSGLRGAASIVFAIVAAVGNDLLQNDIFNIVFCIVLLSIAFQGSLIPYVARKLDMIDASADVMTTFNDFSDKVDIQFSDVEILPDSPWCDKKVMDLHLPNNIILCSHIRQDGSRSIPNGRSVLREGDHVVIGSKTFRSDHPLTILKHQVSSSSRWIGRTLSEYPHGSDQVIMIVRGTESVIPNGNTVINPNDILYINRS